MIAPPRGENLSDLFASAASVVEPSSGLGDLLEAVLAGRPAWHADALCQEHPEIDFFPGPGAAVETAKAVCATCLVKTECRRWALDQGAELVGVWGGTTARSREQIRKGTAPPRPPPVMAADGRPRPVRLMERLSAFLAARPDEAYTASGVRNATSGHVPSIARALDILADEGFVTVEVGATSNGRYYPDVACYRHLMPYIDPGSVTVVAAPGGRSTAA